MQQLAEEEDASPDGEEDGAPVRVIAKDGEVNKVRGEGEGEGDERERGRERERERERGILVSRFAACDVGDGCTSPAFRAAAPLTLVRSISAFTAGGS